MLKVKADFIGAIRDCFLEISEIAAHINKNPFDSKNKYLQMYITLRCCGVVETIYKNIIYDRVVIGVSGTQVINYLDKTLLQSSSNPSYENICSQLKKFDDTWKDSFKKNFVKNDRKLMHLDTLVGLRNKIAHGINITVPSVNDIKEYFYSCCWVLSYLEKATI